jgi:hypothetical protein
MIAPMMPIISTRLWNSGGTAKQLKISRKTRMLSTARLFSMRQPVRSSMLFSLATSAPWSGATAHQNRP